ncbi:hypothetical protein BGV47_27290 [Burkholderia ubonensis]|nr:hypothetical protein BGV47_27290 [Burkholderia ubonensis]OJB26074.1 hypothetical protein BGV55_20690 [Burkholderia ubonensis]
MPMPVSVMTNVTPVAPPVARAHVDVDGDTSGRRKFDSTTQEVHENLTDAGRITAIAACHARPHIDIEPERFRVRQWRQHLRSFADKRAEIERNVFHHHAAGFRFRYIEDVVNQRQQPPGCIHDGAEAAGRIVVRPTVAQEFLMPENRVERRVHLVAHQGQEHGFIWVAPSAASRAPKAARSARLSAVISDATHGSARADR